MNTNVIQLVRGFYLVLLIKQRFITDLMVGIKNQGHNTEIDSRWKRLKRYFAWAGMKLDDIVS
ncbi:hypothetical protein [Salinisphaera sp. G21_0]|uniref:hypothetical protein n=1 Tax=Salinisphaera sp. G21_0 TaxID=2821094 RepID=UPI001ADBDB9D|nr:hypothetical protein [Salinisphaera sp. G21_0]MBO9482984.1 hypothetical protein [Salinisphaera sp. G21_0]